MPAGSPPLEQITGITDAQRQAIYEHMVWFDLNNLPTAADDPYEVTGLVIMENMAIHNPDGSYTVTKGTLEHLLRDTEAPLPVSASTPARTKAVDDIATRMPAFATTRLQNFKRANPNDSPDSRTKYQKEFSREIIRMEANATKPGAPPSTTVPGGGSGTGRPSAPATLPPSTSTSTTPGTSLFILG
jgi:hypothetical protein